MSSFFNMLFGKPKAPKTAMPTPKTLAKPEAESGEDLSRFMKKRRGRAATVLTGALEPMDIGMRTLLG